MYFTTPILIYNIILVICFLSTLLVYFRRSQPLYAKLFPPYIALTIGVETILRTAGLQGIRTVYVSAIFVPIEFVFYFFVLYSIINNRLLKKILVVLLFLFPVLAIINRIFIQPGDVFPSYSTNLGGTLIVVFSTYGLVDTFINSTIGNIIKQQESWIYFGLLVYYGCTFPFYASFNLFDSLTREDWHALGIMHIAFNYVLYLSFAFSFLCPFLFRNKQHP